jgi:hypothetical protein
VRLASNGSVSPGGTPRRWGRCPRLNDESRAVRGLNQGEFATRGPARAAQASDGGLAVPPLPRCLPPPARLVLNDQHVDGGGSGCLDRVRCCGALCSIQGGAAGARWNGPPVADVPAVRTVDRVRRCRDGGQCHEQPERDECDVEIVRLVGHASTRTTEVVYRSELRPVITTGAEIMDEVFTGG